MGEYIDLLIQGNDLVLDPSRQPVLLEDRASIAQDIAHMIRDSGVLVTLVAERSRQRQADCVLQLELLMEDDERLVPGTARIRQDTPGVYLVTAKTLRFGDIEVYL